MKQKRINDVIKTSFRELVYNYYDNELRTVYNTNLLDLHTFAWFIDYMFQNGCESIDSYDDGGDSHDIIKLDNREYNMYVQQNGDVIAERGKFKFIVKFEELEDIKDSLLPEPKSFNKKLHDNSIVEYGDYFQ